MVSVQSSPHLPWYAKDRSCFVSYFAGNRIWQVNLLECAHRDDCANIWRLSNWRTINCTRTAHGSTLDGILPTGQCSIWKAYSTRTHLALHANQGDGGIGRGNKVLRAGSWFGWFVQDAGGLLISRESAKALSLAIAFCGDSELLVLDVPTSCMGELQLDVYTL